MKRILLFLFCVLFFVVAGIYALRTQLTLYLMERVVENNFNTNLLMELPDGLHAALCGAGSPMPDPRRSGPCTAVIAGEKLFLVDVGAGSSRVLSRMSIPHGEIDAIFLTHFHSDHIDGLGEMLLQRWANGAHAKPTPIYGPQGVESVVAGFGRAYSKDQEYRVAHHGKEIVPPSGAGGEPRSFRLPPEGEAPVVYEEAGVKISVFRVNHEPVAPAVGYRFDYKGRSLLISGDTTKSSNLQQFANDVDLLIHEALAPQLVAVLTKGAVAAGRHNIARITRDILDYHATPVEAAEVARDANVKHLLFNHIVPPLLLPPMEELFVEGVAEIYSGPTTVGRDGTLVQLQAGGQSVEVSELLY